MYFNVYMYIYINMYVYYTYIYIKFKPMTMYMVGPSCVLMCEKVFCVCFVFYKLISAVPI